MTPLLWIALGFVAALVVFLMITYLKPDTSSANQHKNLRFLTALCGGFAGGFFTGNALFRLESNYQAAQNLEFREQQGSHCSS
jgi:multisubunit Na+/H+ antiporter MnhB subunit